MKLFILSSGLALFMASVGYRVWSDHTQLNRGAELYRGEAPLSGKIAGNSSTLPVVASRCVNCHEKPTKAPEGSEFQIDKSTSDSKGTYAPRLDRAWLLTSRSRHGGPASTYDAEALCKLLHTGIDPVNVMIPNTMPRYDASPQQCNDLFAFLVSRHEP